jgi:purine-nucleoside phosphorylase
VTVPEDPYELAATAAAALRDRLGTHRVAVVLGSGWAAAADGLGRVTGELPGHELPGTPATTVVGHEGTVRSVRVPTSTGELAALVISGRAHLYEGHAPSTVVHLVRTAVMSGCEAVVLTNAAGSLRPEVGVGTAVAISDHLNLMGVDPMVGAAPPGGLPSRFVDLTDLYDAAWRASLCAARPEVATGVYAGLLGGSFETPAEIRMLRVLGADLVGMSTVLEAIAAHHLGARVLGLSLVTNLAAGLQAHVDHLEVLEAARAATEELRGVLAAALELA